jgi:hypothetical protein
VSPGPGVRSGGEDMGVLRVTPVIDLPPPDAAGAGSEGPGAGNSGGSHEKEGRSVPRNRACRSGGARTVSGRARKLQHPARGARLSALFRTLRPYIPAMWAAWHAAQS